MAIAEALAASKVQLLVAGLVVVGGGTAAAYVATDGFAGVAGSDAAESVPEGVDAVVYFDTAVATDRTTATVTNGLIDISKENNEFYDGPDDYEALLNETTSEANLSADGLNEVVFYGQYPNQTDDSSVAGELSESGYFGLVVDSEWGETEFVDEFSDTEFETREYEGYTVYVEQQDEQSDVPAYLGNDSPPLWVGVLDDGRYVLGTENATTDAIDTDRGAADSFGGQLRSEYDSTRDDGYLRFAATVPAERIPDSGMVAAEQFSAVRNIEVVAGSYYTDGEDIGMSARMTTGSESDADDLQSITDGGIATGKQMTRADETAALLDNVTVEQDGAAVTMRFQMNANTLVDIFEATAEARSGAFSGSASASASGSATESEGTSEAAG